jgi:predicted NBD/HSP70 family sugar kinase
MRAIGIDIGGTKIRGVLWNGEKVVRAIEFSTPASKEDFIERLSAVTIVLSRTETSLPGIGIGAAGVVENTTLLCSPNIRYIKNLDFRTLWPRSLSLRLDNDARCFARSELVCGAGRGAKSLFALTIGTGIGRAYGRKGRVFKIKKFEYPERWEKEYQTLRKARNDRKLADFLAEKLSSLILPFKPEAVVIGGGVLRRERFFSMLRQELEARRLASTIRRASFTRNGGAIGAALLVTARQ